MLHLGSNEVCIVCIDAGNPKMDEDTLQMLKEIAQVGEGCNETLEEVECLFEVWKTVREETLTLMNSTANEIDAHSRNVNIGCSVVQTAAVVTGAVGFASAPLTGGATIPTAAAVAGLVSRGVEYGARVALDDAKHIKLQAIKKKAEEDKVATEQLLDSICKLDNTFEEVKKLHKRICKRREIAAKAEENASQESLLRDSSFQDPQLEEAATAINDYIRQVLSETEDSESTIEPKMARQLRIGLKAIIRIPNIYATMRRKSLMTTKAYTSIASSSLAVSGAVVKAAGDGKAIATAFTGISLAIDAIEAAQTLCSLRLSSETEEAAMLRSNCDRLSKEKDEFEKLYSKFKEQK